jgi:NAD(P)-dependent dehydrogenase (short-subunit alcohol dehydrogenase family)
MPLAIITGASRGLGLALAQALANRRWTLVLDARGAGDLQRAAVELSATTSVQALPGDVSDERHRRALVGAAGGSIDLLVNNASVLGPSPQPALARYPLDALRRVYEVNVIAPLALAQQVTARMPDGAKIINITSDAAVEPYAGWGGYGSSKAALEQLTAILGAETPAIGVYAVDPGDMRTQMHQQAFPGEDISDRPPPAERPGPARADRRRLSVRPLSRPGARGGRRGPRMIAATVRAAGDRFRIAAAPGAFVLPIELEAREPPEARGEQRDAVRLMVARRSSGSIEHARFFDLPGYLDAGDLLVVNVSATLPSACEATRPDGSKVRIHFSTRAPGLGARWRIVELRSADGSKPRQAAAGERLSLTSDGGTLELVAAYAASARLMLARHAGRETLEEHLWQTGEPITYGLSGAAGR